MAASYSTFDIKKKLGIKRERLKEWMAQGFVEPSIQKASGPGTRNLFNLWDCYMIKLFQYLVERGFSREDASERVKSLSKCQSEFPLASKATLHFVVFKRSADKKEDVSEVIHTGTLFPANNLEGIGGSWSISLDDNFYDMVIVNFKKIRTEVDEALG